MRGNAIARVAANIDPRQAKRVIDAKGLYVTPGLIDLHFHSFGYSGSIDPDDTATWPEEPIIVPHQVNPLMAPCRTSAMETVAEQLAVVCRHHGPCRSE